MVQSQPSTHGDETVSRRYRYTSVPAPDSDRPDDGCAVRQPVVEVRLHSAGDAFSLAALLLVRIFPICSLVAPCPGGPRLQFRALGAMLSFHHGLLASVGHHDAVPPLRLDLAHRPVGGLQQFLGRGRHGGQCGHADRGRQPDVEPVAGQKCVRSCADRSRRSPCERRRPSPRAGPDAARRSPGTCGDGPTDRVAATGRAAARSRAARSAP